MFEYDLELVREILRQILWSAQTIAKRFEPITSPGDFIASEDGLEKLDAISIFALAVSLGLLPNSPDDQEVYQRWAVLKGAG
jgi:hypothetical protein